MSPYEQMIYALTRICPGEWDAKTSQKFWDTNRSLHLDQTTSDSHKKKKLLNREVCRSDWPMSEFKRKQKRDKYLALVEN